MEIGEAMAWMVGSCLFVCLSDDRARKIDFAGVRLLSPVGELRIPVANAWHIRYLASY